jgi:chromosome segregation ATPase
MWWQGDMIQFILLLLFFRRWSVYVFDTSIRFSRFFFFFSHGVSSTSSPSTSGAEALRRGLRDVSRVFSARVEECRSSSEMVASLTREVDDLRTELSQTREVVTLHEERYTEVTVRCERTIEQAETLERDVSQRDARLAEAQSELDDLHARQAARDAEVREALGHMRILRDRCDRLARALLEAEALVETRDATVAALEAELAEVRAALQRHHDDKRRLERQERVLLGELREISADFNVVGEGINEML